MAKADGAKVTMELYSHYLDITRKALAKAEISAPERSHLRPVAEDFLKMANDYVRDSEHLAKGGDLVRAVCAVYYAHAWLDAGARLGLFDVGGDDQLFTLAK